MRNPLRARIEKEISGECAIGTRAQIEKRDHHRATSFALIRSESHRAKIEERKQLDAKIAAAPPSLNEHTSDVSEKDGGRDHDRKQKVE
jgi:hypothetical protein